MQEPQKIGFMKKPTKIKHLRGSDIILNLDYMQIYFMDSYSSATCSGPAFFSFDCDTKHGYMEDPDMSGIIKVIEAKKEKDHYILKVSFKRENK